MGKIHLCLHKEEGNIWIHIENFHPLLNHLDWNYKFWISPEQQKDMIKNWTNTGSNNTQHKKSHCTKRGFEIYTHLISFEIEVWDHRKQ